MSTFSETVKPKFLEQRTIWAWPAYILALLLVGRVLIFVVSSGAALSVYNLGIDAESYLRLAHQVASGESLPTSQPPGFVLLLAILVTCFAKPVLVFKLIQCACLLPIYVCTVLLAKRFVGLTTAAYGSLIVLSSAVIAPYAATLQYEIITMLLVVLCSYFMVEHWHATDPLKSQKNLRYACIVTTTGALFREVLLILLLISAITLFFKKTFKREWKTLMLWCVLPISLFVVYRTIDSGQISLISTKTEINLKIGNNPNANGTFNLTSTEIAEPSGFSFIASSPLQASGIIVRKVGYLWGFLKDGWNVPRESTVSLWMLVGGRVPYELLLFISRSLLPIFALIGIALVFLERKRRTETAPLWALLFGVTLVHAIFFGSYRFLVPFLPIASVFAILTIDGILKFFQERSLKTLAIVPGLFLTITGITPESSWHIKGADLETSPDSYIDSTTDALVVRVINARRRVGFLAPEFIPNGKHELSVRYRSPSTVAANSEIGKVVLRAPNGRPICSVVLKAQEELQERVQSCQVGAIIPVYFEVLRKGSAAFEIHDITVKFGQ